MTPRLAELLAHETSALAEVADPAALHRWRCRLVEDIMAERSPYASVLHAEYEPGDRAAFLDGWRELLTAAIARVLDAAPEGRGDTDAGALATLILAAVHGGSILSRVARDPAPLTAALDLAFLPLTPTGREPFASGGPVGPLDSMAS